MELATKIRQARAKLNLTAKQAAERWGINPRTLEDYEQGRRKPRGFALKALNELLDPILAADKPAGPASSESPAPSPAPRKEKRRRLRKPAVPGRAGSKGR